jgi:hypothetical protein
MTLSGNSNKNGLPSGSPFLFLPDMAGKTSLLQTYLTIFGQFVKKLYILASDNDCSLTPDRPLGFRYRWGIAVVLKVVESRHGICKK